MGERPATHVMPLAGISRQKHVAVEWPISASISKQTNLLPFTSANHSPPAITVASDSGGGDTPSPLRFSSARIQQLATLLIPRHFVKVNILSDMA